MASIPFPTYEPPAVAQAQGATLANMMAQRQAEQQQAALQAQQIPLIQQEVQGAQTQNQMNQVRLAQAQRDQQEQQVLQQKFQDNHGDWDSFLQSLPGAGVRPQTVQQLQNEYTQAQSARTHLGAERLGLQAQQSDWLLGSLRSQFSTTDPNTPGALPVFRNAPRDELNGLLDNAVRGGYMDANTAQQYRLAHPNGASAADLQAYASQLQSNSQLLKANQQAALTAEENQRARQSAMTTDDKLRTEAGQYSQFVSDQGSLDAFRKDLQDRGASPNLVNSIPKTYDATSFKDFTDKLAVPITAQPDWIKKQIDRAADPLRVASNIGEYTKSRNSLPPPIRDSFPDLSGADPSSKLTPDQLKAIDDATLNGVQRGEIRRWDAMSNMYGARGNLYNNQANNTAPRTPSQQKALIQQLASKAYNNLANSDVFRDHAPNYDDVMASVLDQNNYMDAGTNAPEMNANRLEVWHYLDDLKRTGQQVTHLGQTINKANQPSDWRSLLQGGGNKPAAPPPPQQPPQQPPPPRTPAQQRSAATAPAAGNAPAANAPAGKMTEEQARQMAIRAHRNPDQFVKTLRDKGLL